MPSVAPKPVLLNMVEHGATPSITLAEAQQLGFDIIIFPFAAIFPAYELKKAGTTGVAAEYTLKKRFTIVGLEEATALDTRAGENMYSAV
ncbi:uncharacterized protein A1O9_11176 [Exophiala aquamarina CBS 119918]|uniref:Uncharacterized protein n=1 Tax=Exophiala aquamarina CBS 119918 TaxID=1182545 RepID=A0A072NY22_9EURO|nr:uncharacterized protein A1O9_11176 [Exophiala aquamarina CBS 119918]KEF52759.1 hypothetical protein A1O9_11176 [Exophiala aquamarina CBS 119918]